LSYSLTCISLLIKTGSVHDFGQMKFFVYNALNTAYLFSIELDTRIALSNEIHVYGTVI